MSFVDDVQVWLRERLEPDSHELELPAGFDLAGRRKVMFEALDQMDYRVRAWAHKRWTGDGFLDRFVAHVYRALCDGIAEGWPEKRLLKLIDLAVRLGVDDTHTPRSQLRPSESLELSRVVERALSYASPSTGSLDELESKVWAPRVRLVDADGRVTSLGRTLLGLTGREALTFLLELETALSTGAWDHDRTSRGMLAALQMGPLHFDKNMPSEVHSPFSYQTARRLDTLGIADREDDSPIDRFHLSDDNRDVVALVLDPNPNPYRALVQSLLDAERGQLAVSLTGQVPASQPDLAYTQMVFHELRNILVPLNHAQSRLWSELDRAGAADPARIAELRQRIDRSLSRITDFTNSAARLAAAVTSETFSLLDVVEEAVQATEVERNGRIAVHLTLDDAHVEGGRGRWTLLFVNLLRNSAQVRAGKGQVWISTEWSLGGALHVFVDDDGPGVPEELREQIFARGVSGHGGSGIGLNEARTTALLSGGELHCEVAPQGGARFHVQVPARRRT